MGTKMYSPKSHVQKVRISEDLRARCMEAKARGAHSEEQESTFYGYLINLGVAVYERKILPIEEGKADDEDIEKPAAIAK